MDDLRPISDVIFSRIMMEEGFVATANSNISRFIMEGELKLLQDEVEEKFAAVLKSLVIDYRNDPNSSDTPKRLAKMYVNELMEGRYTDCPDITSFPNDQAESRYGGMIVTEAEITSLCAHHHQPIRGKAYIGLIAGQKVIGLSKYSRIAQWCAARGTLQEDLTKTIAEQIQRHTGAADLAIIIRATHGCMENRGIRANDVITTTAELRGQFYNPSVKDEFLKYIDFGGRK